MNQFPANALYSLNSQITTSLPFVVFFTNRDPTENDINFPIQKIWYNTITSNAFILVNFTSFSAETQANWQPLSSSGGGGGILWDEITSSQIADINTGYVTNSASRIILTLPITAVVGNVIRIAGKGSGGWSIAQNSGQQILYGTGSSTIGTGGSLSSTYQTDSVEILATTGGTSTIWTVLSNVGNLTII